eukprot:6914768-Lingulodinium_polyedra.AAC.1
MVRLTGLPGPGPAAGFAPRSVRSATCRLRGSATSPNSVSSSSVPPRLSTIVRMSWNAHHRSPRAW